MSKLPNMGIGQRVDKVITNEMDYFEHCPSCGQDFDARDLAQVFYHSKPGHEPLPEEETMRVVRGELRN
ncbi:MAG TPA: hypothetical protein VNS34_10765 [Rhizobiaceae bacterium]|nr:hypothetical protein [Rhizobiaceae bacterium]